ncbi:MAG: NPCBM/NEW2 domain-containing protein [Phycisphaerae bacterium]|nr:NPCBM/NEW2 domain-containing protein [Phycisphaerae bacterium]
MCFVFILPVSLASAAVVETIDAQTYQGEITRLDAKGTTIKTAGGEKTFAAEDLSKLVLNDVADLPDLLKTRSQAVVLTRAGDVVPAQVESLRMEKDQLRIEPGKIGKPMKLPLRHLRAILFPAADQSPEDVLRLCDEIKSEPGANDVLVIERKDGKPQTVVGSLLGIAERKIQFSYHGKERTVKADRLRAILLARPAKAPPAARGWLKTTDGCVYTFSEIEQADAFYTLQRPQSTSINIPRDETANITFHSDRLVYLADLEPSNVRQHGLFDKAIPYRVNYSAGGSPLRLGGREYKTGLGLHSFCELTYDLGGTYRVFIATAGIDDAVRPNGAAALMILADGKAIFPATTLTGREEPMLIRLSVRGAKTLTIRLDFGPDKLDASDHVDLADARLVK